MVYNNSRFKIIARILFLSITLFAFVWLFYTKGIELVTIFAGLFVIVQVWWLFHYIDQTNKDLARFLESIRYSDFTQVFSKSEKGKSFKTLYESFNNVIHDFQKTRTERESQFRYLNTIIQHLGTGIITFDENGDIDLINNAARRMLNVPRLRNINQLESIDAEFVKQFETLPSGKQTIIKLNLKGRLLHILVRPIDFMLNESSIRLVTMQNIQSELDEKEMEAWHNLIRVLTHEIMNSITPISSLASTANVLLNDIPQENCDHETMSDIHQAITTIEKRSAGLLNFVQNYRQLTRYKKPDFKIVKIAEIIQNIIPLFENDFEKYDVQFSLSLNPKSIEISADPDLLEQVIINLIKNALEAVKEEQSRKISVSAFVDEHNSCIFQVSDTGCGIEKDVVENIFIPFFTTKPEGSGIGLSLSRHILRLHNASINVSTGKNNETVFLIRF